mgnify:CR=1 FL=1
MNKLTKLFNILFFKDVYALGYRVNNNDGELTIKADIPYNIIPPTDKEWYADPFLFEYGNECYLFAEIMNYKNKRGSIGVLNLNEDKRRFRIALQESFHLSYPNVFRYKNNIYMIPETCFVKQLRLYKCISFPNKWELEWVMLDDVTYVDTSIYISNDMIFAETHDKTANRNRFFKIDVDNRCIKEIIPTNDKYIDIRNGGNFIKTTSGVFHALQDCENVYGEYLHIAKVDKFDEQGLIETEISQYKVSDIKTTNKKRYERIHTFNRCMDVEVVDLFFSKLDLLHVFPKLIASIKCKLNSNKKQ